MRRGNLGSGRDLPKMSGLSRQRIVVTTTAGPEHLEQVRSDRHAHHPPRIRADVRALIAFDVRDETRKPTSDHPDPARGRS